MLDSIDIQEELDTNEVRQHTQRVVAQVFSLLLIATIIANSWIVILREDITVFQYVTHLKYISWTNWALLGFLVLFALTLKKDSDIARCLQGFYFWLMGAIALLDSAEAFWGWGLLLVSVALLGHYGFWEKKTKLKVVAYAVATLAVFVLAAFKQKRPLLYVLGLVIYAFFIVFFLFFINREGFSRLFWEKQDIRRLIQSMNHDRMVIEEMKECLGDDLSSDRVAELVNKIKVQQALIDNDEKRIREMLAALLNGHGIGEQELELLTLFFFRGGSLTNKECAFLLDTNEEVIKNRFKAIFKKMNVASRTELYSLIIKSA